MIRRNPTRIELKLDDQNEMQPNRKDDEDPEGPKDAAVNTDHKNFLSTDHKNFPNSKN